ncbi:DUF916 and DUF3324 domain-containing protein [Lactiplantibacillus herbarum]|uniref:DUF916 and DUF3324 domain-containing protein n=1 Tax=Lactiplantibacillus herbarum TaxID=1670446 RepID=UPI00064E465B|nr:DUF916 and DUF3324 domain-containing protein [Lactiplantibacillus herbarum]
MHTLRRSWWLMLGLMVGLGAEPMIVHAGSTNSQTTQARFSVSATIPDNQINKQNTFFDLKMSTRKQQDLQVTIYNQANRDLTVATAIHTAYTNNNGSIEYVVPAKTYDSSLKVKMSDIVKIKGKSTVVVPANSSKTVTAHVTMPSSPFNGVMMGGWYFKQVNQKAGANVKDTVNVHNEYSYVVGLKFSLGSMPAPIIKMSKVTTGTRNYQWGILANLRNPSAVMIPNLKLHTIVTNRDSGKKVKEVRSNELQLAPNSAFNYMLPMDKAKLPAGRYHVQMVATSGSHRWRLNQNLKLGRSVTRQTDQLVTKTNKQSTSWGLVGIGAFGTLIIVLLLGWWWLRVHKTK